MSRRYQRRATGEKEELPVSDLDDVRSGNGMHERASAAWTHDAAHHGRRQPRQTNRVLDKIQGALRGLSGWGAEAMRLAQANAKAANHGKGHRRNQTHCKFGHLLSGENLYIPPGRPERKCMTCTKLRYSTPRPPTPEQIQRATDLLNGGSSLNLVCTGKIAGKLVQAPLFSYRKLRFLRVQNFEFDLLVKAATAGSNSRAQLRRWCSGPGRSRRVVAPRMLTREPTSIAPCHEISSSRPARR